MGRSGFRPTILISPHHPVELTYRPAERTFHFPPNHYWAGSKLQVVQIYRNAFY